MLESKCFYKFTKCCQILILTLWFLILTCFLAKIAQILLKVIMSFLERGQEIEPWFWHIWIAQWLKSFLTTAYIFRFRLSSGGKRVVKVGPKVQTLDLYLFYESLSFFSNNVFFLPEYYLWWEFRQYWTIFGRLRAQKPSKKDHFMDAKSVRKTLKSFNLTTSNAVMMKLTTVMYLHESVKRKPLRAKNSIFGVMSTNFQTKLKTATNVCITLHCITGKVFVQIPWKTTQNRFKIIATITFKGL